MPCEVYGQTTKKFSGNEPRVPTLQNNLDLTRYELYQDGQLAAFLQYRMENGQMWLLTTQSLPECPEPALVDVLLLWVLGDVLRRRVEVLPFCPLTRQAMVENPKFLRLIPANPPGHFPLLPTQTGLPQNRKAKSVGRETKRAGAATKGVASDAALA